ncbi:MAG TPA: hypothetical protein VH592_21135 [Gemmataceae bacterium]|jgi:hypothetical protein
MSHPRSLDDVLRELHQRYLTAAVGDSENEGIDPDTAARRRDALAGIISDRRRSRLRLESEARQREGYPQHNAY